MIDFQGVPRDAQHLGGYAIDEVGSGTFVPAIWDALIEITGCKTVTDVGCGLGYAGKHFQSKGCHVLGVDGCDVPVPFELIRHDYTKGPLHLPERDLCWSAEFVEHVEERFTENFLATFDCHRWLALTHALPGWCGHHHVNCRWPTYWIDRLVSRGWALDAVTFDLRTQLDRKDDAVRCVKETLLVFSRVDS